MNPFVQIVLNSSSSLASQVADWTINNDQRKEKEVLAQDIRCLLQIPIASYPQRLIQHQI